MNLIVRSTAEPANLIPALRSRILEVDRFTPITRIRTLEEMVADSIGQQRFYMLLLALFAGIAATLAAIGIYGVLAYSVVQRTHEIGIRMALGAQAGDVLKLVIRHGMTMTLIGVVLGLAASAALTRLMAGLLFGVSATDPLTFVIVTGFLAGVALLACYLPARRATKVDPITALRYE
jgi:putative ABC transport system permease protein